MQRTSSRSNEMHERNFYLKNPIDFEKYALKDPEFSKWYVCVSQSFFGQLFIIDCNLVSIRHILRMNVIRIVQEN